MYPCLGPLAGVIGKLLVPWKAQRHASHCAPQNDNSPNSVNCRGSDGVAKRPPGRFREAFSSAAEGGVLLCRGTKSFIFTYHN